MHRVRAYERAASAGLDPHFLRRGVVLSHHVRCRRRAGASSAAASDIVRTRSAQLKGGLGRIITSFVQYALLFIADEV